MGTIEGTWHDKGGRSYNDSVKGVRHTLHFGDGNDRVTTHTSSYLRAYLGTGNDWLKINNRAVTWAHIHDGDGNDYVNAGAVNLTIHASSGRDHYHIASGANTHIYLGHGHKTVTTGGLLKINIHESYKWWGGRSDRNIKISSASEARVETGYGNDHIEALGVFKMVVKSLGGNNRVIARGAHSDVTTGSQNDNITASGVKTYVRAGEGHNYVDARGAGVKVWAGGGNDTIDVRAFVGGAWLGDGNNTVNFHVAAGNVHVGKGNDTINVRALGASINAGSGNNVINAHTGVGLITAGGGNDTANVYAALGGRIDLGHGNNTVNFKAGIGTVKVGDGHDTINVRALGAGIDARGGNNVINAHTGVGVIKAGGGNDTLNVYAALGGSVDLGHGHNTVNFKTGIGTVKVGNGNDTINVRALGASINAGGGNNIINAHTGVGLITAGGGHDTVNVLAALGGTIDAGGGNNVVNFKGFAGDVKVGDGNDRVEVRAFGVKIDVKGGENLIDVGAAGASITAGSGDDYAYVGAAVGLLDLGHGDNYVVLKVLGGNVRVGDGNDTIFVRGLGADIKAGNGDNIIDAGTFGVKATTGSGNDRIYSLGVGGQEIDSGNGNDIITAYGGLNIVSAGHGHNDIRVGGVGNIVQAGYGDNVISAYGGLNVILAGHGRNAIEAIGGGNIVLTGNGENDIVAGGGLNLVVAGDGKNTIFAAGGFNIIMAGNGGTTANTQRTAPTLSDKGPNLVVNGSFESGAHNLQYQSYTRVDAIDGWTKSIGGQNALHDLFDDGFEGISSDSGRVRVELAGTEHTGIYQDISTRDGATYEVSLKYIARLTDQGADANDIEVWWDGQKIDTISSTDKSWSTHTYQVEGAEGTDTTRLELRSAGSVSWGGAQIDDVRVQELIGYREVVFSDKQEESATDPLLGRENGNVIEAYGTGNLVISGDGDDKIRAGSLLGLASAAAINAANKSDNDIVNEVFGTSDGTLYGEETVGSLLTNMMSGIGNLGNVIIAGDGDNVVKAFGGANLIQSGSGDDYIVAFGLGNMIVAGNGRNKLQLVGNTNVVWGGTGDDEVQALGADNLLLLGDGNNRVTAIGYPTATSYIGNVVIGAGGIDDVIVTGGKNILLLGGGDNFAIAIGVINVLQGASGDDFFAAIGAGNLFLAGDGDNFMIGIGAGNLALSGEGDDFALLLGKANIGLFGNGENRIFLGGKFNLALTGSDDDTVVGIALGNVISTASGRDNIVVGGKINVVLAGGDNDITIMAGKLNFLMAGWGDDISVMVGETNIALTEGGDDISLAIGKSNVVFAGSGDDITAVIGKQNVVLAGTGNDIVLAVGKSNFVATDNEIHFNLAEIQLYQSTKTDDNGKVTEEGAKDAAFQKNVTKITNGGTESTTTTTPTSAGTKSKNGDVGASFGAEVGVFADFAFLFPDIEFSDESVPDWSFPTLTLKQYDYDVPDIPELKSAPDYKYGKLGDYGLPQISLPDISTPELQLPGQTIPSFTLPDLSEFDLQLETGGFSFDLDYSLGNDLFADILNFGKDFTGEEQSDGPAGQIFGGNISSSNYIWGNEVGTTATVNQKTDLGVVQGGGTGTGFAGTKVDGSEDPYFTGTAGGSYDAIQTRGEAGEASTDSGRGPIGVTVMSHDFDGSDATVNWTGTWHHISDEKAARVTDQMATTISDLTGNRTYEVTVKYQPGSNLAAASHDVGVFVGNEQIGTLSPKDNSGAVQTHTFRFRADAKPENTQLEFRSLADGELLGTGEIHSVAVHESNVSTILLPTLSLPEMQIPAFQLNDLDLSGLDTLDSTIANREFFGLKIPDFDIPEDQLKIPGFNIDDYVDRDETKLDAQSFTIPSFDIPNFAGIKWDQRIPNLSHEFAILQSRLVDRQENLVSARNALGIEVSDKQEVYGDVAVVAGKDNHVYTGRGDDVALLLGKRNVLYAGAENDIALLLGKTNFAQLDNGGAAGNDIAFAIGEKNIIAAKGGNDVIVAIGKSNNISGAGANVVLVIGETNSYSSFSEFSGADVVIALGKENTVSTGWGDDTILVAGVENTVSSSFDDDIVVAVGKTNEVKLGAGNDFAAVVGLENKVIGDETAALNGDDIIFALGAKNHIEGNGGNDSLFAAGVQNKIYAGGDDDLVIVSGVGNKTSLGDGDDAAVNIAFGSFITGGLGNDLLINVGTAFAAFGNGDDDTFINIGAGYSSGGGGQDNFLNFGIAALETFSDAGLSAVNKAFGQVLSAFNVVLEPLGVDLEDALSGFFSLTDNQIQQGGGGNDVFYAGFGNAVVFGESGDDRYVYTLGSGEFAIVEGGDTDLEGYLTKQSKLADGLNEERAGEQASAGTDDEVDIIEIRTSALQSDVQLGQANIVLSADNDEIDVVVSGQSLGQISISRLEDSDIIRIVDSDSTEDVTFGALKSYWAANDAEAFTEFNSLASLENGVSQTLKWLQDAEGAPSSEVADAGREVATGSFSAVSDVYNDLYAAKTAVDNVITPKTEQAA